jgi:hypothetical protein
VTGNVITYWLGQIPPCTFAEWSWSSSRAYYWWLQIRPSINARGDYT